MDNELSEALKEIQYKMLSYELLLSDLIYAAWPLESHRQERRENMRALIEQSVEENSFSPAECEHIMKAAMSLDSLFDAASSIESLPSIGTAH